MNNNTQNIGIIPAEYIDTFRAGVELDINKEGKVIGVRFDTFKNALGRGITLNPVAIDIIKERGVVENIGNGKFSKFNANA